VGSGLAGKIAITDPGDRVAEPRRSKEAGVTDHFEQFDEDNLRLDPLEEGMDPPEHWAQADKFGNTEREVREGEDLDHRLAQEEPDPTDRLPATTGRLDDSIDDGSDAEVLVQDEPRAAEPGWATRHGTTADEGGGSVARELRTPLDEPE
jgi:hypothetical protein